jgi:Protein of unknown function (DUF5131)
LSDQSAIEWTDATWNPVTGCSKVSPGCAHCYAETLSLRFGWSKRPWLPQYAAENVVLHPERLDQPLRWRRPRMVFVNSMSDLFHELVPDAFVFDVFDRMARADWHTYQILTKRPERMAAAVQAYYVRHPGQPPLFLSPALAVFDYQLIRSVRQNLGKWEQPLTSVPFVGTRKASRSRPVLDGVGRGDSEKTSGPANAHEAFVPERAEDLGEILSGR